VADGALDGDGPRIMAVGYGYGHGHGITATDRGHGHGITATDRGHGHGSRPRAWPPGTRVGHTGARVRICNKWVIALDALY
jgi:hypothetical protein